MKFSTLIGILTLCSGTVFTLVDLGSDVALAYEYWNYSVTPTLSSTEWFNISNYSIYSNHSIYLAYRNTTEYRRAEGEYTRYYITEYGGLSRGENSDYAVLTIFWISLGGLVQFIFVLCFQGKACMKWLPKPIRMLLLLCSLFLMAPVVINTYGAISIICNSDEDENGMQGELFRLN